MTAVAWSPPVRRLLALILLALFGLVACAPGGGSGEPGGQPAATATGQPDPSVASPSDDDAEATTTVAAYFGNQERGDPCDDVFPVDREVAADAPLRGALQALLAGPTEAEAAEGYGGWFSSATEGMLNSVRIADGTAHVDFADFSEVVPNASTSCGSALLLGQLDATVTQFDTVDRVRYSFDGDVAAFYHWLQLEVPEVALTR